MTLCKSFVRRGGGADHIILNNSNLQKSTECLPMTRGGFYWDFHKYFIFLLVFFLFFFYYVRKRARTRSAVTSTRNTCVNERQKHGARQLTQANNGNPKAPPTTHGSNSHASVMAALSAADYRPNDPRTCVQCRPKLKSR